MNRIGTAVIAAALSLAMSPVAFAQDDDAARLTVSGHVMVSSGGEYVSADDGQAVAPGQSLMVAEESAATVTYEDNCKLSYTEPGTYVIPQDEECERIAALAAQGATGTGAGVGTGVGASAATTAAIVAGVVAATAAGIQSGLDDKDNAGPPLSP